MKPLSPTAMRREFDLTGKLLLSIASVLVFISILGLVMKVHAQFLASKARLRDPPAIYMGKPSLLAARNPAIHPFWPEFPRSDAGTLQGAVINGVQIMTENWESGASSCEILAYYREQMVARGWTDETEETYNLQPDRRAQGKVQNGLQDPQFVTRYRNIMETYLALRRGQWTLHITAESSGKNAERTAVKIYAAETSSINKFAGSFAEALTGNENQEASRKTIDSVQQSGGQRYHTKISYQSQTPANAFETTLANLKKDNWHPMFSSSIKKVRQGLLAVLVKGDQYGTLSVNPSREGKGASVTWIEVSPE